MQANEPAAADRLPSSPWVMSLVAWVVGVALQLQQPQLWASEVYACIAALALVIYAGVATKYVAKRISKLPRLVVLVVWVGCSLALGAASTGWRAAHFVSTALPLGLEGRDVDVLGVVVDLPQVQAAGVRFRLEPVSAWLDGEPVRLPGLIDVGWYSGWGGSAGGGLELQRQPVGVRPGERWRVRLRLKAPHGNINPHGFDYELHLWEQGVQATGYVRAGSQDPPPQRLHESWQHPVDRARHAVRERIQSHVEDRQAAALVSALVVGDQAAIDRADWDVYRATGIAHLVSISGMHVTLFAWLAAVVLGRCWRLSRTACLWLPAPTVALWGGVLSALAYALFAGWGVPAQRTVLMLAVVALLRSSGARWPWPLVWWSACVSVVLWDPWALLQAGFWLSFVAVGILFATDSGASSAYSTGARGRFHGLLREQWRIGLGLAPLAIVLFGQVSVVGLLANLLAVPWVTFLLTPLALVGVLWPTAWDLAALAATAMHAVLAPLAQWPLAVWWWPRPPWGVGIAACLGAAVMVLPWSWRMRSLGLPLVVPLLLWRPPVPAQGEFALLAADVGQGNAVVVRTAKHTLVFDAGPRYGLETDAGHRVLVPLLQAMQWAPDVLMLSHRDADHVGGAAAVLGQFAQTALRSSLEPHHPLLQLRQGVRCEAGQHWRWDDVDFSVLHPTAADYHVQPLPAPNTLSCVLRISNGRRSALLAGDIEARQEARLLQDAAPLRADVLLVPHHGSKTSSSEAFVQAVAPQFAWVQSGYRNRFGHPAPPVLQRYQAQGVVVLDSPHCGAMHWHSDRPEVVQCERDLQRRYWRHRAP